jgi:aromatic-L-amino-acid decarboxylase
MPGKWFNHFYCTKMEKPDYKPALEKAFQVGINFLENLDSEPVDVQLDFNQMKTLWDWDLPVQGKAPAEVIEELDRSARPGLVHNQSGRFFSWVIGGSHPSALAADWLTSVWDQNAGLYTATPASSIVEDIAGTWLKQIFHLPSHASFAFVTGGQMANFTCLCAARNALFHQAGWDIEKNGFYGAPRLRIITGDHKHSTITKALRLLGFGTMHTIEIPSDDAGRINVDLVAAEFSRDTDQPTLLILQAGELHTGAFDDFKSIIPLAKQHNAWVHVDGAFGLWGIASRRFEHLLKGVELADSWTVDGHKWLNVPYDCGYAFVAQPDAHFLSQSQHAEYLIQEENARDQMNWTLELSRRARGYATWATIKSLGTTGIEELVNRLCDLTRMMVDGIKDHPQVEVIAYPIINQALVRFIPKVNLDDRAIATFTEKVIDSINASGEAFYQPSTYKGKRVMRISVCGWRTNNNDIERTVHAIRDAIEVNNEIIVSPQP